MADVEDEGGGVPEWVVTYGDMMSLLLTFFIMLVSMSVMKQEGQVRAALDAIRAAFGPTLSTNGVPGRSTQRTGAYPKQGSDGARSEGGTKRSSRNAEGPSGAHRTVQRINHGTVVTLGGPTLFERFDATLSDGMTENLDVVADVLADRPNQLVVRGHASPEPLPDGREMVVDGIPVEDQFDLSFVRAARVGRYLVEHGIDPERVEVTAAGATEPRIRTRNREEQRQNDRVDVFLIDSYTAPPQR